MVHEQEGRQGDLSSLPGARSCRQYADEGRGRHSALLLVGGLGRRGPRATAGKAQGAGRVSAKIKYKSQMMLGALWQPSPAYQYSPARIKNP
jgi:hypothetical protein